MSSLVGYVLVYVFCGGVYGDGILVKGGFFVMLLYWVNCYLGRKWCLDFLVRVIVLEFEVGIFY